MTPKSTLAVIALAFLSACLNRADHDMTAAEASAAANGVMAEHLPQVPLNRLRIETEDKGASWRVSYHPPQDSTGGPIVVDVNKQNGEAAIVSMEQ